jgi:hypothetical protein
VIWHERDEEGRVLLPRRPGLSLREHYRRQGLADYRIDQLLRR